MANGTPLTPVTRTPLSGPPDAPTEKPLRAGMPMIESIASRETLTSPRPGGATYRVIERWIRLARSYLCCPVFSQRIQVGWRVTPSFRERAALSGLLPRRPEF